MIERGACTLCYNWWYYIEVIIIAGSIVVILGGLVGCGLIFNCLRLKKKRNEKERLGKITFKRKSHFFD